MIFPQNRKDGRSNLSPHQMNMGDIRTFVLNQLFYLLCSLKVIEIVDHILNLFQRSLTGFLRLREILAIRRRIILFPLQGKVNDLVTMLLQQFASIEANRFRTTFIIIIYVD